MRSHAHIDELVAADVPAATFVQSLQDLAIDSPTANHPLLLALREGSFHDLRGATRRFVAQYYVYSHGFTRYLGAAIASLGSPEHRAALIGNGSEEAGHVDADHEASLRAGGIDPRDVAAPHPELFRRFLRAIGVGPPEALLREPLVSTLVWSETFFDICRFGGEAQSVGALGIATEGIVGTMYRHILAGIRLAWPDLSARDRAFFDLHALVDDDHAEALRRIALDLSQTVAGRRGVAIGALKALRARGAFFDDMLVHLRNEDETSRAA